MSMKGWPSQKKSLDKISGHENEERQAFVTLQPIGSDRIAQDVLPKGAWDVTAGIPDTVEANSEGRLIIATAHVARVGDVIKFETGNNTGNEFHVTSIATNQIVIGTEPGVAIGVGDTFSILRTVTPRYDNDGNLSIAGLSSTSYPQDSAFVPGGDGQMILTRRQDTLAVTTTTDGDFQEFKTNANGALYTDDQGTVKFNRDGSTIEVLEDTVTPANNRPLPVKLSSVTGDINITAGDLNVATSHTNDSIRLGDGTTLTNVTLAGELEVADTTLRNGNTFHDLDTGAGTENTQGISIRMSQSGGSYEAKGQQTRVNSLPVTVSNEDQAILERAKNIQDDAFVTAEYLNMLGARRQDSLAASTSADGDNQELKTNANGELYVTDSQILAQLQTLNAGIGVVDQLDAGALDPSTTNIPRSSNNAVSVVAALASDVRKIQTIEDVGEFMAIYSDATRTSLICYLPLAGGEVDVSIASGTTVYIGAVKDSDITTDTRLMIQFLG
jgi:hypothetical protein